MKKKALLSAIITIALCLSIISGSTFALFTSESKVDVSVGAANVEVVAVAKDFQLTSSLEGNLAETKAQFDETKNTVTLENAVPGDSVTFNLVITNKSTVTISYRTVIKMVSNDGLWSGLKISIDGTEYGGATKRSDWAKLAPGSADIVVPVVITLPEEAGNEYIAKSCTFAYTVEAVQGNVKTTNIADDAADLSEKLDKGGDVSLTEDFDFSAGETESNSGYGATGIEVNGGTLNGNGNRVNVTNANATWDCAISTTGGVIKNLTVSGAMRGIFMPGATSDLLIDNVVFEDVIYTFNSDAGSKEYSVTIKNSTLNGWTSFSDVHKSVTFDNCLFGEGSGYAYCRPYNAATFTGCTFEEGYVIDARNNIVLDNCYYGDTLITSENLASLGFIAGVDKVTVVDYAVVDGVYEVHTEAGIDAAIKDGASTIKLGSGSFIIPDSAQGKTLTIVGNGVDTVVATQDDGSYEGCDYSFDGATVTFEGITINTDSSTYTGYARMSATYNKCTINGQYTLYGDSVFNECTFNVSGDAYNIWTWGAKNLEFNDCTFNNDGKALLVYNQSSNVTLNGCTFNDRTNGTGFTKSAIETGVDGVGAATYNIYINNTTVNGYAENDKCVGYKNVVGNKNNMSNEYLNIVVDGEDVF